MTTQQLPEPATPAASAGHWLEVLAAFLRLGLTSFGGPIAHLGYFRAEFVERRNGSTRRPTPTWSRSASSCPGRRAARSGSRSACCGPAIRARWRRGSALRCHRRSRSCSSPMGSARSATSLGGGWLHGLKVVAVAVVAQAVLGMMRTLAPDRERATLAVVAARDRAGRPVRLGPGRGDRGGRPHRRRAAAQQRAGRPRRRCRSR